jgi:hypothetical protein
MSVLGVGEGLSFTNSVDSVSDQLDSTKIETSKYILSQGSQASYEPKRLHQYRHFSQLEQANDLSSFSLTHLSEESKKEIKYLSGQIGKLIQKYNLQPEDLEFILEAVPDSRSLLIPKWTSDAKERLEKIQQFITICKDASRGVFSDVFNHPASLVCDIETLSTALGYCALCPRSPQLGPPWVKKSKDRAPESVRACIADIDQGEFLVNSIGESKPWVRAFPARFSEFVDISPEEAEKSSLVELYQKTHLEPTQTLLIAPHIQPSLGKALERRQGLKPRCFTGQSYPAKSINMGVHMRSHVSGSAPLTLAAMSFLDSLGKNTISEDRLFTRAGLIISTYQLGDYHSFAETAAGVAHYHQMNFMKQDPSGFYVSDQVQCLEQISAPVFLSLALGHMLRTVDGQYAEEFQRMQQPILEAVGSRVGVSKRARRPGEVFEI